jgi:hypothetical protein
MMLQIQTLDELERRVAVAELQAQTIVAAFHPDQAVLVSTEKLERMVINILNEQQSRPLSPMLSQLFAWKVRLRSALDRMRSVSRARGAVVF